MSKPLTIDELKALEVGDWVWLISCKDSDASYGQIDEWMGEKIIRSDRACITIDKCDYGIRWIAYKNKEQAEAKDYKILHDGEHSIEVYRYVPAHYQPFFTCDTMEEAERRLAELKREKQ